MLHLARVFGDGLEVAFRHEAVADYEHRLKLRVELGDGADWIASNRGRGGVSADRSERESGGETSCGGSRSMAQLEWAWAWAWAEAWMWEWVRPCS